MTLWSDPIDFAAGETIVGKKKNAKKEMERGTRRVDVGRPCITDRLPREWPCRDFEFHAGDGIDNTPPFIFESIAAYLHAIL